MTGAFRQVTVKTDAAICDQCGAAIERGSNCLMSFTSKRAKKFTAVCDEVCLADYKESLSPDQKKFNRLKVQFN